MNTEWSEFDVACMRRALELAERGRAQVSPNPPVGCVLTQDGKIIAEGWHDHLGDLHAEQAAIADAEAELMAEGQREAFYQSARMEWSQRLRDALEELDPQTAIADKASAASAAFEMEESDLQPSD